MVDEQVDKLIVRVVLGLNLLEHGLCFLEQNETLLIGLLGDKVDG